MYCPRCGQQQISDEMRFCSRCGLPMSGLSEWLGGVGAPDVREQKSQVSARSQRREGMRRGAKLLFLSGVLFPVFLLIGLLFNEGAVMIIPIIILFVALVMMLYARLFGEEIPLLKSQQPLTHGLAAKGLGALPPAANIPPHGPENFAGQRVWTNELAQPPSVTEHTTTLLDKE